MSDQTTLEVVLSSESTVGNPIIETVTVIGTVPIGPRGIDGIDGADGIDGTDGADGQGVPTGGTTGQRLRKASNADFDTEWFTAAADGVETIVAGSNIDVDATDPANPVISVEALVDADIPASIARDSEVTSAVAAEATARDAAIETHRADTTNVHGIADTAGLALLASPTFTGTPAAPTAAAATNTTQIATTAFVATAVANLIASAPGALDTLDELAAALGDDSNFAATMTTALAGKQPLDADLTAIAALSTTAYGRGLLTAATDTILTGDGSITSIVALTQAEYDALGTPDATTYYIITDATGGASVQSVDGLTGDVDLSGTYAPLAAVDTVLVDPTGFFGETGSPAQAVLSGSTSSYPILLMDAASTERIVTARILPPHWNTFDVVLLWANAGAGSGDVRWQFTSHRKGTWVGGGGGADIWLIGGGTAAAAVTAAANAQNELVETAIATSVTIDHPGENLLYSMMVARLGADGADTLGNDVGVVGLRLERTS